MILVPISPTTISQTLQPPFGLLCVLLTIAQFICSTDTHAQKLGINLSDSHSKKIASTKIGHQRLKRFYRYYRIDSGRHVKRSLRHYEDKLDSTLRAARKRHRLQARMVRQGIVIPNDKLSLADSLNNELRKYSSIYKDTTATDSERTIALRTIKTLAAKKMQMYPGYQELSSQYGISKDSISWRDIGKHVEGMDTLAGMFDNDPRQLFDMVEKESLKQLGTFPEASALSSVGMPKDILETPDELGDYKALRGEGALKKKAREKAVAEGIDYFSIHASKLNAAHAKVSKLMNKYRDFSSSMNLKDAVKQTSLQGKTFWERLVVAGNFNIVSTDPLSVDLNPQLGYKLNTKFAFGVGMSYRQTFGDSIRSGRYISPTNTGFSFFSKYEAMKGFFAYAEAVRAAAKNAQIENVEWTNIYFVGIGKRIPLSKYLDINTMLLYNLNGDGRDLIHPSRFQIKLGVQLSELATRKEKIIYNPNR